MKSGHRCAIVTRIRGNRRFKHCRVLGEYAHAGAVPRADRRDAVLAAVEFVSGLEGMWVRREAAGEDLVCTVGHFYTDPAVHTITKIPGEVRLSLDLRSYDEPVLADCHAELERLAARISTDRAVSVELGEHTRAPAAAMDGELMALLRRAAGRLGIEAPELSSGAGHDCAVFATQRVPSAMIFIRNYHSSRNPKEEMAIEDFAEASRLLHAALDELIA